MLSTCELVSVRGANQTGNFQQSGATCWSSHFSSVGSFIDRFGPTYTVIQNIIEKGSTSSMRGEAKGVHVGMKKFDYVFILHILQKTMGITDLLCQALEQKSQDITNAMNLATTTKRLLQQFKDHGWEDFIDIVVSFCRKYGIDMPDLNVPHMKGSRSCQQHDNITVEHHLCFDIFNDIISYQLMELNSRFTEDAMELLILSSSLDLRNAFKSFKKKKICRLASKFYPQDFSKHDIDLLRCQLQHYKLDVLVHPHFRDMSTIYKLCQGLVETRKEEDYTLIDRLIRLVLKLPVSTANTG